ncbi:MAG: hypothetical protein ACPKPY_05755 [Nitrososphaeraceae archaeon]
MNKKIVYASGAIIILLIVTYLFQTSEFFSNNDPREATFNEDAIREAKSMEISLNNLSVQQDENNDILIITKFDAYNPNKGTLLLENIRYNIYRDDFRVVSGDIGQEPEGFVASQEGLYPIIGNSTVTLKDEQLLKKDIRTSEIWNKLINNTNTFNIEGTYSFTQTSSFQAIGETKEFNFTATI